MLGPRKIVCMTEELVEWLYLLGEQERIVGVSGFVKRPPEARQKKRVCAFTSGNLEKIHNLDPDLIVGFSDIQKDLARDLIGLNHNVYIANHRSLQETLDYLLMTAAMVGKEALGRRILQSYRKKMDEIDQLTKKLHSRPKVYFEEWGDPLICGIQWVSELIQLCGGTDICQSMASGKAAKERMATWDFIRQADPDMMLVCWCGKPMNLPEIQAREGFSELKISRPGAVTELLPEVFLQPGPALFESGLDELSELFSNWSKEATEL